jgi:hypothetical protein
LTTTKNLSHESVRGAGRAIVTRVPPPLRNKLPGKGGEFLVGGGEFSVRGGELSVKGGNFSVWEEENTQSEGVNSQS